jgi:hypothetical protein
MDLFTTAATTHRLNNSARAQHIELADDKVMTTAKIRFCAWQTPLRQTSLDHMVPRGHCRNASIPGVQAPRLYRICADTEDLCGSASSSQSVAQRPAIVAIARSLKLQVRAGFRQRSLRC